MVLHKNLLLMPLVYVPLCYVSGNKNVKCLVMKTYAKSSDYLIVLMMNCLKIKKGELTYGK